MTMKLDTHLFDSLCYTRESHDPIEIDNSLTV